MMNPENAGMMERYDAVIIGAGLGGLQCGFILAKNGMKVCIVEKNSKIGGCLQTFRRNDSFFDTGFHYVGGLGEGEPLHRLFRYFGLLDLPWHPLDREAYDEVVIGNQHFFFANGYERFIERLVEPFPAQRKNLMNYTSFLKEVGEHLFEPFATGYSQDAYTFSLFARSAYEFMNEMIDDPLLRKVLSGASLKMELNAATLPLYTFAQINHSFMQSAWRLQGGGMQIAESLARQIRGMGGEIRTGAAVTRLTESNGRLAEVEINGEERIAGDWVISDVHPAHTLSLIDETKRLRPVYRKRIASLSNTFGMFTVQLRLKPGYVPYLNRNVYIHRQETDLWRFAPEQPLSSVLVSCYVPETKDGYAQQMDLLAPVDWNRMAEWKAKPAGRRGKAYDALKTALAQECIGLAARHIPGLRDGISEIYTSTPLTYAHYTNTVEGSAYGIRKDCERPEYTVLTPRTPVPNLLLTGQNLNLHGVLGVSVTSFLTCAEILGRETAIKDLHI
ncbi:MAG: NAD(P)/FAD-dependent oxidoreductase [Tannerella sp.]|jgi:all-trans-retinol 13,14-reductase|nr:NAD(P)/FAD-dependent oxidoreductase [Tannerella sp.]